jgi:hypothetical protein
VTTSSRDHPRGARLFRTVGNAIAGAQALEACPGPAVAEERFILLALAPAFAL